MSDLPFCKFYNSVNTDSDNLNDLNKYAPEACFLRY